MSPQPVLLGALMIHTFWLIYRRSHLHPTSKGNCDRVSLSIAPLGKVGGLVNGGNSRLLYAGTQISALPLPRAGVTIGEAYL